jgi:hypothetical protein
MAFLEEFPKEVPTPSERQFMTAFFTKLETLGLSGCCEVITHFKIKELRSFPLDSKGKAGGTGGSGGSSAAAADSSQAPPRPRAKYLLTIAFNPFAQLKVGDLSDLQALSEARQIMIKVLTAPPINAELGRGAAPPPQVERQVRKELTRTQRKANSK